MENPRMLYRPGTETRVWNKYDVDTLVVDESETERHLADGWHLRPGDWEQGEAAGAGGQPNLLDNPANVIIPALADKPLDELEALMAAEQAGKTRKGIVAAIQAEIDKRLAA